MRDFYATAANVIPILMLALIWESSFLERLRTQARPRRKDAPDGVLFWTKRRVRVWTIFVMLVAAIELGLCLMVLGGFVDDGFTLRTVVIVGVACVLASLVTRAVVDTIEATKE